MTLPAKPKRTISSQKNILIGCGIGAAVIIILVITMAFPGSTTTLDHSILVDPTKEQQSLFLLARVTIQNTGNQSITNITIKNLMFIFSLFATSCEPSFPYHLFFGSGGY